MISFLDKLAQEFSTRNLSRTCFVFPTRRAAYIFRQGLIKQVNKTVLLPELFGIRDFVATVSPLPIAEPLPLLLTLYDVYREFENSITLEKFIPWAEIILHDFNEIDLQLIPAAKLFQRIYDLKEIEAGFQLEEEDAQQIAEFWKLFSNQELTPLQQTFLTNWEILPKVYDAFKQKLITNKFIYEGMAYRSLAEKPDEHTVLNQWDTIVFAGFYALSNAEEKIIHHLQQQNKAEVFWDVDNYYFEDRNQEAGKYLRKNSLLNADFNWKADYFNQQPKDIYITGVPMQEAQAKWIGLQLEKDMQQPDFVAANTVIVLPSESLLLPVLYALPESLQGLNITMGYPVKQSTIYSLLVLVLQLHNAAEQTQNKTAFVSSQLQLFIQHPLVVNRVSAELVNLITKSDSAYLSASSLKTNDELIDQCLKPIQQHTSLLPSLIRITKLAKSQLSDTINQQVIDFVGDELEKLHQHIQPYLAQLNLTVLIKLVSDQFRTLKIPFTGEPISGVQVMGFLETRVLDFERVYILSVNEDNLPASARGKSYIPYSLRKSFGLPVQDDQDAVYAYHFYRLLQRAKQVHLLYNTEVKSSSGGEKSRYLLQLAQEAAAKTNGNVRVHFQQVNIPVQATKETPIVIPKTDAIIAIMQTKYLQSETNGKGLSPTALNDFLHCSLKFYYKQIAGIREPDEIKTELSPDVFGRIFHSAMQLLYNEHELLDSELLKNLEAKINDKVDEALADVLKRKITGGNDYLLLQIIKELVRKVLLTDAKEAPLRVISLEQKQSAVLTVPAVGAIKLEGYFDRIDEQQGIVRIVDYKTGGDTIPTTDLLEKVFSVTKYKASFQLLLYALIYSKNNPTVQIKAGIYPLQKATQGIKFLTDDKPIDSALLNAFAEKLTALIQQIFNTQEVFTKTTDIERCVYCEFKNICGRQITLS